MSELSSAGDAATGLLVAHAIEPYGDRAVQGNATAGLCLHCRTRLSGDFYDRFGQAAHVHRTLASMGHHLLHDVFHF